MLKAFDPILTLSLRFTKVGLLIGPRGNTLKKMETESQAKIAIRGKGSVKEGKGRSDAAHTSNQEEDLHCLIMADTEEKVEKAKKLIHNIIETVNFLQFGVSHDLLIYCRLHLSPRAKMSSSATNFVNSLLLTVPSVMMRTKLARTVVRLATENTTAHNNATLLPILSVACVEMQDTWLEIVQIDHVVPIGATMVHLVQMLSQVKAVLVLAMLSTVNMR